MAYGPQDRRSTEIARSDGDVRVEDYLNDKIQAIADLASIDSLLADAQKQQSLLEQQASRSKDHKLSL